MPHIHRVTIYYEDTDLSGVVYHANYFKFFERAREELLGPSELARVWQEHGVGFAVYKLDCTFRAPADMAIPSKSYQVKSKIVEKSLPQSCWRQASQAIGGRFGQLVCIDHQGKLSDT